MGILGEDVKRLTDRFSSIGNKQEKITEEFRQLNISVDKVINRFKSVFYKAFPKNKNQNKTW